MKISKLKLSHPCYPRQFKELFKPPAVLYIATENFDILTKNIPKIAVVGSRRPTIYGQSWTIKLAEFLCANNITIVSGMAIGIDSLALKTAVYKQLPCIAVLPCSFDRIYPAVNQQLAKRIVELGGVLITEYPLGSNLMKHHFIERNRLIASISDGVLVTEAARKSGSLHTANFAVEYGKELMTIPCSLDNPNGQGNNNLIKNGAHIITEPIDMLHAIGIVQSAKPKIPLVENEVQYYIVQSLAANPISLDELCQSSDYPASEINLNISLLELQGVIKCLGMGIWTLTS